MYGRWEAGDERLDFIFVKTNSSSVRVEVIDANVPTMRVDGGSVPGQWRRALDRAPDTASLSLSDHYPVQCLLRTNHVNK